LTAVWAASFVERYLESNSFFWWSFRWRKRSSGTLGIPWQIHLPLQNDLNVPNMLEPTQTFTNKSWHLNEGLKLTSFVDVILF